MWGPTSNTSLVSSSGEYCYILYYEGATSMNDNRPVKQLDIVDGRVVVLYESPPTLNMMIGSFGGWPLALPR